MLTSSGIHVTSIQQFTDECASQYKGKHAFSDISANGIPLTRHFFVTSHGKNVCDGLGAVVKNMALRHVMGNNIIKDSQDLYTFCNQKVAHDSQEISKGGQSHVSKREFVYVEVSKVDHQRSEINTLKGTSCLSISKQSKFAITV